MKNKELLSGDEAIARGAIEAGISFASSYPGTPATEILEYLAKNFKGKAEWAINEKIALETAIGASYTGKRALCSMKHVGLNVAADPLMTSAYTGIKGGLTIAVADDPGSQSSQNEQDSRFYAKFAKLPCLEPSNSQEAKDMTIQAFELSEKFEIPVFLRSVTRISHASSPVTIGKIRKENSIAIEKNPKKLIAVPSHVIKLHKELNDKQKDIAKWGEKSGLNKVFKGKKKKGIIACGIGYEYAKEYGDDFSVLKISFYPVQEELIKNFVKGLKEVYVLEEGEPFIEEKAKKYSKNVKGKLSGDIRMEGELGTEAIIKFAPKFKNIEGLAKRLPMLCQGCGHRDLYTALKKAEPNFTAGDIGCYTLGVNPPFEAIDTCLCMGASISQAAGISHGGVKRVAAIIGDSTFLHAGIPALISAVYNKANITVIIMDNNSTAMTGHQPTPLTGITAKGLPGGKVVLEEICKACGISSLEVIDPKDAEKTTQLIKEKLSSEGVHVIIARRPCIFAKK